MIHYSKFGVRYGQRASRSTISWDRVATLNVKGFRYELDLTAERVAAALVGEITPGAGQIQASDIGKVLVVDHDVDGGWVDRINAKPTIAPNTTREKDIAASRGRTYGPLRDGARFFVDCAFADGCAHRDEQVIAYLRKRLAASFYPDELASVLADIERGEHVK
jgi:hypothetical protein